MKSEWEIVSLGKYIIHKKGYAFKSSQYKAFGTPIVKVTNLTEDSINMNDVVYTDDETASANKSVALFTGDSIVTTVGSWATNPASVVGKTVKVPNEAIGALLNQNAVIIRPLDDNIDKSFLYYVLKNDSFGKYLVSSAQGSASQASITLDDIYSYETLIPSIPTQKKISHILSTLDDKIELNRKMNQTLEEMAQALFKSWFVDFDPVHVKAKCSSDEELETAACELGISKEILELFPSEFEESELGMIPKGWEVKPLSTIAHYQNGLALQKFRPLDESNYLPVLKIAQLNKGYTDGEEKADINIKPECIVDSGDIIFSWSGTLIVDIWCGGKAALNQHLFKVTSNDFPKWFYYYWTKQHLYWFKHIAASKAVTMGHIKRSHLDEALCCIPSKSVFTKSEELIGELVEKVISNRLEVQTLQKTRDTLLPKLLSGELDVSELDIDME